MKLSRLIICFLIIITACKSKDQVPSDIIPAPKIQAILWDLMRADQFIGTYLVIKDSSVDKTTESLKYYQRIFNLHEVTRDEFQKSFTFYRQHPAFFKAIMDSINKPGLAPTQIIEPAPLLANPDTTDKGQQPLVRDTLLKKIKKHPPVLFITRY